MTHFLFDTSSPFDGSDSEKMAELLMAADRGERGRLRNEFGITADVSSDPPKIDYQGRKVGSGRFSTDGGVVTFEITPKVLSGFQQLVDDLAKNLSGLNLARKLMSVESSLGRSHSPINAHIQIGLVDAIAEYAETHVDPTHLRKFATPSWTPRGKFEVARTVQQFARGGIRGVITSIPDELGFAPYANVLLATVSDIEEQTASMAAISNDLARHVNTRIRFIRSRLGPYTDKRITVADVVKLSRPPFPLGLRSIMLACLRHWIWKEQQGQTRKGVSGRVRSMVLDADLIFQAWVGVLFERILGAGFRHTEDSYQYTIGSNSTKLIPDHLYVNEKAAMAVVVDAKYRLSTDADQVYQLLAYGSFKYPDVPREVTVAAVIARPGDKLSIDEVSGFEKPVFVYTLPFTHHGISPLFSAGQVMSV